ncbi:MAG: NADPH-dependent FMN reductase [Bacteroidales bacterium]|jgi:NAD(P)H-dependent FMN reductase|nr:NAD(P)H-dependent oxidoreductase [Bacteroidales bacterium]MDD3724008.1 NAD(P)H-dependent oxidoreductase [Bacteroidales bacterium]MDD4544512.1 NAD(P)H-dependent oxidoreductase [Bacteroidales bacterium]MDY0053123.1 NAD(P)H-dependent oxidoreductase [Bacteroidales bacterium]
MKNIAIISSSVRKNRASHKIALYVKQYMESNKMAKCDILDLKEFNFPLFDERLMFMENPSKEVLDYVERFDKADGIIIISPVYNQGFPASLKNVIDLLYPQWKRKVVGLITATASPYIGVAPYFQIENILMRMGAIVTPTTYNATEIDSLFDKDGVPVDINKINKQLSPMVEEFIWMVERLKE